MTSAARRLLSICLLAHAVLPGPPGVAAAAPQGMRAGGEPEFQEETRVTAIDLAIELRNSLGTVSKGVGPRDLRVRHGEEDLRVVSIASLAAGEGREPWRLVVWVDPLRTDRKTLLAGAATLARQAAALVALGSVEVVVADPAPRLALPATRVASEVDEALSRVALAMDGEDRLGELRRRHREGAAAGGAASPAASEAAIEDAYAALAEEVEMAQGSLDALLEWAAEDPARGPRALFLVHGGYDVAPRAFYGDPAARLPGLPDPGADLAALTRRTAEAVAGFGWLVFPLDFDALEPVRGEDASSFDRQRYLALDGDAGRSMAVIPFRRTFGGAKKETADEEAKDEPPLFTDAAAPLRALASTTSGALVSRPEQVAETLRLLGRRLLVTFEAPWPLDGELRPVRVVARGGGLAARAPAWVRSATPEAVAEARVRRMVAGAPLAGPLAVRLDGGGGALRVSVGLAGAEAPQPPPEPGPVRITLAQAAEGAPALFHHQVVPGPLAGPAWQQALEVNPLPASRWLLVMVENLSDGLWGAQGMDLEGP